MAKMDHEKRNPDATRRTTAKERAGYGWHNDVALEFSGNGSTKPELRWGQGRRAKGRSANFSTGVDS